MIPRKLIGFPDYPAGTPASGGVGVARGVSVMCFIRPQDFGKANRGNSVLRKSGKPVDKTVLTVYTVNIQFEGDEMNIYIDNKSGAPIYDQIYTQIKNQIISGDLREDEALPSIRNLAKDLRISVITTKRAYDELEREGFIYTLPAKGCFVAPKNVELLREENLKKIEEYMQKIIRLAASCNLTGDELAEMFRISLEE